jgi:hypothetical protein
MNWSETVTNAPYNTINLPSNEDLKLKNPEHKKQYYDPTTPIVEDYLKTNKSMYDNRGKFFDWNLFNKKFDQYIEQQNEERLLKQKVKLYDLDSISNIEISPYQLPLNKLLINFKNVWFKLFDDIINNKNILENFNTNNLFYFGISFIIIYIIFIMLTYIFE